VSGIGLLGGSFDPVHAAHLALARRALRELALDEVQLIPAHAPWQREPLAAPANHRRAMLELALAGEPGLSLNPVELERGGPTYTIDTLRALPPGRYVWLLGADQLANFCTWREWREMVRRVELAVAHRPGAPLAPPPALQERLRECGRQLIELPFEEMPVSASEIRRLLGQGLPVNGMLPSGVEDYIRRHRLYGT